MTDANVETGTEVPGTVLSAAQQLAAMRQAGSGRTINRTPEQALRDEQYNGQKALGEKYLGELNWSPAEIAGALRRQGTDSGFLARVSFKEGILLKLPIVEGNRKTVQYSFFEATRIVEGKEVKEIVPAITIIGVDIPPSALNIFAPSINVAMEVEAIKKK